jgi:mono/diheme cytochrome c family protein
VLDDDLQLVGEQLGVAYAGQAFVIDPVTRQVLYAGPVDASGARTRAKGYLAEALRDVTGGRTPAVMKVAGKGAAIAFPERGRKALHQSISYSKDVAPILEAKCVVCHQEGGIGPFAMSSYSVVKGFAPMIRESIRTDSMPPWHPDPTVGKFAHDQSLSDEQIRTIVHWVEAGAPRGEGADPLATTPHVAPEWPLGKPDLVLDIPSYKVPASGVVEYQYPATVNPLTENRWVRAATLMPGDRRSVHHILAGYMSKPPAAGGRNTMAWESSYGEYAVGGQSFTVPDDIGIMLPAGGSMGFQLHYTPYGKEAVDSSKMGLYFYPAGVTPKKIMRHFVIADPYIELPANTDFHKEVAYTKFPKDAVLHSVFLHTHYRGQAARFDLVAPDGKTTTLINLPRYDFNWQRTYDFETPVAIPAGSKLVATYWYDNSVRNPGNPNPNETVIWGDQSWEEMHYTSIYFRWTDETTDKPADAMPIMNQMRSIGILDDNLNEKIEEAELRGSLGTALRPRFAELDVDKDGALGPMELRAAAQYLPRFGRGGEGQGTGEAPRAP